MTDADNGDSLFDVARKLVRRGYSPKEAKRLIELSINDPNSEELSALDLEGVVFIKGSGLDRL